METFKETPEEILKYQISRNKKASSRRKTDGRTKSRMSYARVLKKVFSSCKRILSIGCRSKSELKFLKHRGYKVVGIDVIPGNHVVMDAHEIGEHFEENQFDVVYAVHSIEHMYDVRQVFLGIRKVARLGCFIVVPTYRQKYLPNISHPTILDIMTKNRARMNKVTPKDLEDFKVMQPFDLVNYKFNQRRPRQRTKINECQLALRWVKC